MTVLFQLNIYIYSMWFVAIYIINLFVYTEDLWLLKWPLIHVNQPFIAHLKMCTYFLFFCLSWISLLCLIFLYKLQYWANDLFRLYTRRLICLMFTKIFFLRNVQFVFEAYGVILFWILRRYFKNLATVI